MAIITPVVTKLAVLHPHFGGDILRWISPTNTNICGKCIFEFIYARFSGNSRLLYKIL